MRPKVEPLTDDFISPPLVQCKRNHKERSDFDIPAGGVWGVGWGLYWALSRPIWCYQCITKTRLFKYTENLTTKKMKIFRYKNSDFFHISAQSMNCRYSLEPPRWGGSNEYPQSMFLSRNKKNNVYPCKPQFYYIKVGFKGVKII